MILRLHSFSVPIPPSHPLPPPPLPPSLPPSLPLPPCSGDTGVRDHHFFEDVNWQDLLREKAEFFIPQLQGDEDTSYFDSASSFLLLGSPYFSHFPCFCPSPHRYVCNCRHLFCTLYLASSNCFIYHPISCFFLPPSPPLSSGREVSHAICICSGLHTRHTGISCCVFARAYTLGTLVSHAAYLLGPTH